MESNEREEAGLNKIKKGGRTNQTLFIRTGTRLG